MATNPISEVVELALYHGREETNIEYKGDVPWTNRKKEREIMQSIFAMSNEEDGGIILIGVADDGTRTGLSTANFATYSHDTINRRIENKGNQPIACKVDKITLKDKVDGITEVRLAVLAITFMLCVALMPLAFSGASIFGMRLPMSVSLARGFTIESMPASYVASISASAIA